MKNNAVEIFSEIPKRCNCAQAVAIGLGHEELTESLSSCGGGRAPEGLCGALHAALLLVPEEKKEQLMADFKNTAGSVYCKDIRQAGIFSCTKCVETAAALAEKILSE